MGASGAVFEYFFSAGPGSFLAFGVMALWAIVPILLAVKLFRRKNL